jgi:hypothetical protein
VTEQRTFRALGGVDQGTLPPAGEVADALRAEFERVFALKRGLQGEAEAGVSPTGRRTTAQDEAKLRTLVASVEGASRLAIRLRLLTPGQVRALWAEAMANGLYDGWDAGQSAYGHAPEPGAEPATAGPGAGDPATGRGDRPEGSGEPHERGGLRPPRGPRPGAPVDREGGA